MIPRLIPVIAGRAGARWPFAGTCYGSADDGDPTGPWVSWVARVGGAPVDDADLEGLWRASRVLQRALLRAARPDRSRRVALAGVIAGLDLGLVLPGLGPLAAIPADELTLLLLVGDADGVSVCGTGLDRLVALGGGEVWIDPGHPMAQVRGALTPRAGAMAIPWRDLVRPPRWLVAVPPDCPGDGDWIRRCALDAGELA